MGVPVERDSSHEDTSWLGPSLPWLLQPQSLSQRLMLIHGTATDTVDMDGEATTDLMATMATTERDLPMLSQSLLLLLILTLILMPGTDTTATGTVAGDGVATTGLTAPMATTERGPPSLSPQLLLSLMLMLIRGTDMDTVVMDGVATTGLMATMATTEKGLPSLSPQLLLNLLLLLILTLILMPGTDTTATDTVAGDGAATTGLMDMGVTGEVTGAKQTNREVDSSSDCDFLSTLASISRACA